MGRDFPIVDGMSSAELEEFKTWLRECCGYDFDEMDVYQRADCASRWYDELFYAANEIDENLIG